MKVLPESSWFDVVPIHPIGARNSILRPFQYPSLKVPPAPVGAGQQAKISLPNRRFRSKRRLNILPVYMWRVKDKLAFLTFSTIPTKPYSCPSITPQGIGPTASRRHKKSRGRRARSALRRCRVDELGTAFTPASRTCVCRPEAWRLPASSDRRCRTSPEPLRR